MTTLEDLIDENGEIPDLMPMTQECYDTMKQDIGDYFANLFAKELKELRDNKANNLSESE